MKKNLLIECILIVLGLIFFSNIYGLDILKEHPTIWLFLIGVILCITNIIGLPLQSWTSSGASIGLGSILILISFILTCYYIHFNGRAPGEPTKTPIEMAQEYNGSEWLITVKYNDKYDIEHAEEFPFKGAAKKAETYMENVKRYWQERHPNLTIMSIEKDLCYIPPEYSRYN